MQSINRITIFIAICFVISCASKKQLPSTPESLDYQKSKIEHPTHYNSSTSKVVTQMKGYGNNAFSAATVAEKAAYEHLLFRGIPGTSQAYPIIKDEIAFRKTKGDLLDAFFSEGEYEKFTLSSTVIEPYSKRTKNTLIEFHINHLALSRALEQRKIISKFGL